MDTPINLGIGMAFGAVLATCMSWRYLLSPRGLSRERLPELIVVATVIIMAAFGVIAEDMLNK